MYIYAIGTSGDRQKIGYSADPHERLKKLQTGNPEELHVHYMFEIDEKYAPQYEKYIHKDQNHKRVKGEWFSMTPEEVKATLTFHEIMMESTLAIL